MTRAEAYWILHEMMVETFSADQSKALSMALHDIQFVDLIPNDMVHVVRCKDCKHYEPKSNGQRSCFNDNWNQEFDIPTSPDDYCSYGERKEADGK